MRSPSASAPGSCQLLHRLALGSPKPRVRAQNKCLACMPNGRHDSCPLMPQPQSAACFTASCRGSATGRISEARPRRALGGPTPSSGGCSGGSGVTRGSAARRRRGRRRRNGTASRRAARVSGRIHHASCVRPVISINCSVCHGPPLEAPSPPLLPCHALQRQPRFQRDPSASPKSENGPRKAITTNKGRWFTYSLLCRGTKARQP